MKKISLSFSFETQSHLVSNLWSGNHQVLFWSERGVTHYLDEHGAVHRKKRILFNSCCHSPWKFGRIVVEGTIPNNFVGHCLDPQTLMTLGEDNRGGMLKATLPVTISDIPEPFVPEFLSWCTMHWLMSNWQCKHFSILPIGISVRSRIKSDCFGRRIKRGIINIVVVTTSECGLVTRLLSKHSPFRNHPICSIPLICNDYNSIYVHLAVIRCNSLSTNTLRHLLPMPQPLPQDAWQFDNCPVYPLQKTKYRCCIL